MHSDDHILETFLASNKPLATIAADLTLTLVALIRWMDKNADLLAEAKRAMENHIAFLALKAEAAALIDLTNVSSSTTNEERKRKSASQLLRHSAKRLLSAAGVSPSSRVASLPNAESRMQNAGPAASMPPTNPERVGGKLTAPGGSRSPSDLLDQLASSSRSATSSLAASMPSSLSIPERVGSTLRAPCTSAAADPPYSDLSLEELRARLAPHFGVDLAANDQDPQSHAQPTTVAASATPA